ncbi:Tudor and KH domain-containing protein, partial [Geodia barretti]
GVAHTWFAVSFAGYSYCRVAVLSPSTRCAAFVSALLRSSTRAARAPSFTHACSWIAAAALLACGQEVQRESQSSEMKMAWRGYQYMLGMVLLVPTAIVVTMLWAWRRIRGARGAMLEGGPARQLRQGTSEEFTIPAEAVGYVIGRQGQRVREMERTSGARIRFKDQQDNEDKIVVISGSTEAVKTASERVKECVMKVEEKETDVSVGVPVPVYAIGRLIGRGGANIRAIQRESGAKVNVPSDGSEGTVECEVVGSAVEIDRAVALIQESIQQSELSRRRKAVHSRQKTRKPATTPPVEEIQLVYSQLPLSNDFFPAFVSAVDRDGTIWLQRVDGSDSAHLDQLVDTMTNDYSKLGPEELLPGEIVEGGVVAAPFPHDQNWYRARVVGVADSTLQLLFLDFGDKASVEVAMVKSLRPQYYRLPVQAIPCRLSRIQPTGGSWSDKAIELLDSLSLCATWKVVMVMVEVKGEERSEIKIVDTTTDKDIDVAEQLVEEGMAEWSMERPLGDGEDSPDSKVPVTLEWVDGRSVSVAGSFSEWEPVPLSRT